MWKRKHSVLADLSFQGMLVLMLLAMVFFSYDHIHLAENGILLFLATVLFIVVYFTSLRTGLALDLVFLFLLLAYTVYRSLYKGISVQPGVYFWIFWPLGMILAITGYVRLNRLLDEENVKLVRKSEKYTTIDELTQMNNLLAFERDASVYMNISRRYRLQLELVLWRLNGQEDMERLLNEEDKKTAVERISDSIKGSLRKEDLVYLVDKKPFVWGTLLFSRPDAAQIVISHVREGVGGTKLQDLTGQNGFSLEITGTVVTYDGSMLSPLAFLNQAKSRLWSMEYPTVTQTEERETENEPDKTERPDLTQRTEKRLQIQRNHQPKRAGGQEKREDRKKNAVRRPDSLGERKSRLYIHKKGEEIYEKQKRKDSSCGNFPGILLDRLQRTGKGSAGAARGGKPVPGRGESESSNHGKCGGPAGAARRRGDRERAGSGRKR